MVAVLARVAWVIYAPVNPNDGRHNDSVFYHNAAHALAQGQGYLDQFGRVTAHWPPAYPATLALVYKAFGWHVWAANALNIALAALTVVLAYVIARRLFDQRAAYVGALVLALFPGQLFFSTLTMTETMFGFAFLLVLLLTLLWTVERRGRWWQALVIGLLVGVTALVRSEGIFLAPVLAAIWALTARPWRAVVGHGALLAAGVVLALTPWTVRNAVQLHDFIPLRAHVGSAVAHGLDPEATRPAYGLGDVRLSVGEGLRYQLRHPWEAPDLFRRKVRDLYEDDSDGLRWIQSPPSPGRDTPNWEPTLNEDQLAFWGKLADRYFFGAGAAALVVAAVCLASRSRRHLPFLVAALGWTMLFGLIYPVTRYHFPLGPLIAMYAGAFVVFAFDAVFAAPHRLAEWSKALRRERGPAAAGRPREAGS